MNTNVRDVPLKEFVDSHHKAIDDDLAELRRSNENEGVPLILAETEEILSILTSLTSPKRILELGTAHGYSAGMAEYLFDKHSETHWDTVRAKPQAGFPQPQG